MAKLVDLDRLREIAEVEFADIVELANYIKRNTDQQIFPSVKITEFDGKNVVIIEVKEDTERPVFFKNHAHKGVGKTNQRISSVGKKTAYLELSALIGKGLLLSTGKGRSVRYIARF